MQVLSWAVTGRSSGSETEDGPISQPGRSPGWAALYVGEHLPSDRRCSLEDSLMGYFGTDKGYPSSSSPPPRGVKTGWGSSSRGGGEEGRKEQRDPLRCSGSSPVFILLSGRSLRCDAPLLPLELLQWDLWSPFLAQSGGILPSRLPSYRLPVAGSPPGEGRTAMRNTVMICSWSATGIRRVRQGCSWFSRGFGPTPCSGRSSRKLST